jgi:murein DD-endopeptidase MepM/ murein hydrolase activator NlpD
MVVTKEENSEKLVYKKVTELFRNEVEYLFKIKLSSGEQIVTTWNHPFRKMNTDINRNYSTAVVSLIGFMEKDSTTKEEWIEAKDLRKSDNLVNSNGDKVTIASIESLGVQKTTVYNFEVEDTHSYFVGKEGIWVHNYEMQEPSNRTGVGRLWDSIFNRSGEGIIDTNSGEYTGRVYRDGGSFFGLFGATIYHERINSNTGNTEMVNIRSVTGDNDQVYRHETSFSRTNNGGKEINDYIWSGNSRNAATTNARNFVSNSSDSILYRQSVRINIDGTTTTRLVGENNLFTSGVIKNDNPKNYNTIATNTRLLPVSPSDNYPIHSQTDYQVFRNDKDTPLKGNFIMGGYTVSNRENPENPNSRRENYFSISTQENDATPNRYEITRRVGNQTITEETHSPLTNMSLSHPYHGAVADYPAGTFTSSIHQPGGPHAKGHFGIDLLGNPDLFAVEGGRVVSINPSNNTITILTDSNRTISYLHASGIAGNIFPNQVIKGGSYIGRMGNIGTSAGAHLHLEGVGNTKKFFERYGGGQRGCGTSPNCSIQ